MNKISVAYDVLSNPTSKGEYDKSSKVLIRLKSQAQPITTNEFSNLILK
jgi:curved DNA-binding protein CbpA